MSTRAGKPSGAKVEAKAVSRPASAAAKQAAAPSSAATPVATNVEAKAAIAVSTDGDDEAGASASRGPPTKFYLRTDKLAYAIGAPYEELKAPTAAGKNTLICNEGMDVSRDGTRIAVIGTDAVRVHTIADESLLFTVERKHVQYVQWSPMGTHLVTWERKSDVRENLFVWNGSTGAEVLRMYHRDFEPDLWPLLQWSNDEEVMVHQIGDILHVLNGHTLAKDTPLFKLTVVGLAQFSVAPNAAVPTIATFIPPLNASPARISIYCLPSAEPKSQKSFFKSNTVIFKWNAASTHVLTTAMSQQGTSYYGESSLHLLAADNSINCTVGTGNVSDAAWSPQGRDFIAIQGEQPAKPILYVVDPKDGLKAIREFGEASRNTIRWSPHGRFLCLAGFGSLAGEMDFWDRLKFKKLGSAVDRGAPRYFHWSPDSRTFVTATLRPYRRVDNGVKVWSYAGESLYTEKIDTLHGVISIPAPAGVYVSRPASPRLADKRKTAPAPAAPTAYIPVHLRRAGATAPASIGNKPLEGPRKLKQLEQQVIGGTASRDRTTPGVNAEAAEAAKKAAQKLKKKEADKERKETAKAAAAEEAAKKSGKPVEAKVDVVADLLAADDIEREVRKVQKKLREIQQLKDKLAETAGATPEPAQQDKLNKEVELKATLAALQAKLK